MASKCRDHGVPAFNVPPSHAVKDVSRALEVTTLGVHVNQTVHHKVVLPDMLPVDELVDLLSLL
uniref:Uncharacterized protein n=1 Tax=Arundo donax TaxID=35708 RepID=A0A0A8ZWF0_ARUDO